MVGQRAIACEMLLHTKIILADFNQAVSTPIAKPPNLIPCQIFGYMGYTTVAGTTPGTTPTYQQSLIHTSLIFTESCW